MGDDETMRRRGAMAPALLAPIALVSALILAQAWYTDLSTSHFLNEELGESVRNPIWVANGVVYDGVSSNVGWYALVAAGYRLFGFSFVLPKIARLLLHAISLGCLWHLLVQCCGWRRALVPMAVLGLSPTLLYFNTFATTYGIDLQWAPIIAVLAWYAWSGSRWSSLAAHAILGLSVMLACLMWPVCVFYVPLWGGVYLMRSRATRAGDWRLPIAVTIVSAALPFIGVLAWLQNAGTWLRDPVTGSGAFRGGGIGGVDSLQAFAGNLARMALDAAVSGSSYYFWLPRPDLSGVLGWTAVVAVLVMIPALWRRSVDMRVLLVLLTAAGVGAASVAAATGGPPGLRRATICLAVFHVLYVLSWWLATEQLRSGRRPRTARPVVAALSLLLVHHVLAFIPNARGLRPDVPGAESAWFPSRSTPLESLKRWEDSLEAGGALDCRMVPIAASSCRYAEVYAAIAAGRRWSEGRHETPILAYDPDGGHFVTLSPETWPFGSRR
jgi:hypothetical protein